MGTIACCVRTQRRDNSGDCDHPRITPAVHQQECAQRSNTGCRVERGDDDDTECPRDGRSVGPTIGHHLLQQIHHHAPGQNLERINMHGVHYIGIGQ